MVGVAALLLSCQVVVEPRPITVQDAARPDFIVTIVDRANVVVSVRVLPQPSLPIAWDWGRAHILVSGHSAAMAEILWVDLRCRNRPTIVFYAALDRLRISVDPGPKAHADCEGAALVMGVAVTFSRPYSADQLAIDKLVPSN